MPIQPGFPPRFESYDPQLQGSLHSQLALDQEVSLRLENARRTAVALAKDLHQRPGFYESLPQALATTMPIIVLGEAVGLTAKQSVMRRFDAESILEDAQYAANARLHHASEQRTADRDLPEGIMFGRPSHCYKLGNLLVTGTGYVVESSAAYDDISALPGLNEAALAQWRATAPAEARLGFVTLSVPTYIGKLERPDRLVEILQQYHDQNNGTSIWNT